TARAAMPGRHALGRLSGTQELARDIDAPHLLEAGLDHLGDRRHLVHDAGVIEEGRDAAKLPVDGLEQTHNVSLPADIRLHSNGAAARLLDLLDHSFGAGGVAIVVDRDLVPALRAKSCRRSADAPAAA